MHATTKRKIRFVTLCVPRKNFNVTYLSRQENRIEGMAISPLRLIGSRGGNFRVLWLFFDRVTLLWSWTTVYRRPGVPTKLIVKSTTCLFGSAEATKLAA